ncbi:MAG: heavy-metal-associated domain-containing protein [Myxococcales bacterium]|nr:heavy-metal-associated domain-containing protein [Myxococcales bacterium]
MKTTTNPVKLVMLGFGLLVSTLFVLACTKTETTHTPVAVNQEAGEPKQVVFEVKGMTCGGCEQAITERLSSLDGVVSVKADRHKERTWVTYHDPTIQPAQLEKEITELGYNAHQITEPGLTPTHSEPK